MRRARWPAWLLGAVTLAVAAAGLALLVWDWSAPVPAGSFGIRGFSGLFAVCFGGVGALLTWRHPGHPVGWIIAAAGLVGAVDFATFEYGLAASAGRAHLPAAGYVGWLQLWIWVPLIALITVYHRQIRAAAAERGYACGGVQITAPVRHPVAILAPAPPTIA